MVCSKLVAILLVGLLAADVQGWVRRKDEDEEKEKENVKPKEKVPPTPDVTVNEDFSALDRIIALNSKAKETAGLQEKKDLLAGDGGAMIEGDIIYTKDVKNYIDSKKSNPEEDISPFDAIANGQWPKGIVYYQYARNFGYGSIVQQAMKVISSKVPCIQFRKRTSRNRDYIEFIHDGGCYSMIGRQGGRQPVSLGNGCGQLGVAIHEIMHALGFYHEQSRRDRDSYIRINFGNIPRSVQYNFEKYRAGQASTLGEPYDKQSIMHYGNYAFSNNGRKTIESRSNPNERLGQRQGLSVIDIRQLKKYYGCSDGTGVTPTKKPVVPSGSCSDKSTLCSQFKSLGACRLSWITSNCKKSCNHSSCKSKKTCTNKSTHCSSWSRSNQYCRNSGGCCKNRRYLDYMQKNCGKACGFC